MYHERIFASFVLFTLIRLWIAAGGFSPHSPHSPHIALYTGSLMLIAFGTVVTRVSDSSWAQRSRLVIYPILMNVLFVDMRAVSPLINDGKRDSVLWEIDRLLVGGSLSIRLQQFISPALTELLSFCYMFFMIYLFLSMLAWLFSNIKTARIFYSGLFSLYGIGYFGYTLVPAIGPYIVYADRFSVPLNGWFLTDFLTAIYPSGTNYTDIFPSLHVAVSAYLLFFDMKRRRARFWICLLPCAGIWFSTIYLRYHYFVDVMAGFALAAFALYITRLARLREESTPG